MNLWVIIYKFDGVGYFFLVLSVKSYFLDKNVLNFFYLRLVYKLLDDYVLFYIIMEKYFWLVDLYFWLKVLGCFRV